MHSDPLYESILEKINNIEILDTHEHLFGFEKDRDKHGDFLSEYLIHYFNRDLASAGAPGEIIEAAIDPSRDIMERWRLVEPYWEEVRYTGYGRALDIAVKGIYGIEGIYRDTVNDLNRKYKQALTGETHYEQVLKDLSKIKVSILDNRETKGNIDPRFFRYSFRIDFLVQPKNYGEMREAANLAGIPLRSAQDWIAVCEALLNREKARGTVALKCALAYTRSLRFDHISPTRDTLDFSWFHTSKTLPDFDERPLLPPKDFQDMMMHYILRWAESNGMPVQVHTGYQEGNGNLLDHSNPEHLNDLFLMYEGVKFDLFHIGYPYLLAAGALAKMFPNVYLDMCWAHILSPKSARDALSEWLETIPLNKISGFGGDYRLIDGVYGHVLLARQNIAAVLTEKVKEQLFDEKTAVNIAEKLLLTNPASLYNIDISGEK